MQFFQSDCLLIMNIQSKLLVGTCMDMCAIVLCTKVRCGCASLYAWYIRFSCWEEVWEMMQICLLNILSIHPHLRFYNGNQYWIVRNRALTWHQARNACRRLWGGRGRLATINSLAENNFVYSQFGNGRNVWLGGSDVRREGHWVWDNGCTIRRWAFLLRCVDF